MAFLKREVSSLWTAPLFFCPAYNKACLRLPAKPLFSGFKADEHLSS